MTTTSSNTLACFFCWRDLSKATHVTYVGEGPICSMCLAKISLPRVDMLDWQRGISYNSNSLAP